MCQAWLYICNSYNDLVTIVDIYFFLRSSLLPYLISIHYLGTCPFSHVRHDTPVAAINYAIPSPWIYMQTIDIGQFNQSSSMGCFQLDPRDTGLYFLVEKLWRESWYKRKEIKGNEERNTDGIGVWFWASLSFITAFDSIWLCQPIHYLNCQKAIFIGFWLLATRRLIAILIKQTGIHMLSPVSH